MKFQKVVSAREMARIEKKSFEEGNSPDDYMDAAGHGIAARVEAYCKETHSKKQVALLIGKGNNGGDAFTAGMYLMRHGFEVSAFHLFRLDECSELCEQRCRQFQREGGEVYYPKSTEDLALYKRGVIVDGLLGTGFQGTVEGLLAEVIAFVNQQDIPVIAIDIPSGVHGSTGEVPSDAIIATETCYLGLPKIGMLIGDGYAHAGEMHHVDFGLPSQYIDEAVALALTCDGDDASLPTPKPQRHKYEAGYVLTLAGSKGMSGAAYLSSYASLKIGAGIVRLFHQPGMELSGKPWEVIAEPLDARRVLEEAERAGALVIGPGFGSADTLKPLLEEVLLPTVIDAESIALIPHLSCKQPIIATPHKGELAHLISSYDSELQLLELCQNYVEETDIVLIVKGAPTFIFMQGSDPLLLPVGNPGMATAGAGDVLSGILGGLLAQNVPAKEAAPLAVYIHGLAGDYASELKTEWGMTASDILHAIPDVLHML